MFSSAKSMHFHKKKETKMYRSEVREHFDEAWTSAWAVVVKPRWFFEI